MGLAKQVKLIQLMGNLLANGFHLGEVVSFLGRSKLVEADFVGQMRDGLADGKNLAEILQGLQFSQNVVTQVELAQLHGDLTGTLRLIEQNLRKNLAVRKKLISVAIYPVILLVLLLGIMLGLKNYLLPQVSNGADFATRLINALPSLFLAGSVGLAVGVGFASLIFKRRSALWRFEFLGRVPILSDFIKFYLTAYFAREWGNLMAQGLELRQVVEIMQGQKSQIFREVGEVLAKRLAGGVTFSHAVADLPIFRSELALMIEYGELKDKLGLELGLYADECWAEFFVKVDRSIQVIQPVAFVFVALMIVLLYAAMLLPIYSNMSTMM